MAEPNTITIGGAKVGFNGKLAVTGYGSMVVRVEKIGYGLGVISSEASAAHYKVFYPHIVTSGSFTLTLLLKNWAEREALNKWVSGYIRKVTTGQLSHGNVLATVPVRRFSKSGVPTGGLQYGDDIAESGKIYRVALSFAGASTPLTARDASKFRAAKAKDDAALAAFYPGGSQRGGAESLAGTLFDTTVDADPILVYQTAPGDD